MYRTLRLVCRVSLRSLILFVLAVSGNCTSLADSPTVRVVATSQQPGINTIDAMGMSINAAGLATFRSSGGRNWSEAGGTLQIVADVGAAAPGTNCLFDDDIFPSIMNSQGDIAFYDLVQGGNANATNNAGIWIGRHNALNLVVRTGDQAPGLASGVNFASIVYDSVSSLHVIAANDQGTVAFQAQVVGAGIDPNRNVGLWAGVPGNLQLIAMDNQPAPASLGTMIAVRRPTINHSGNVAFTSSILPPSGDAIAGVMKSVGGTLSAVAKTGDVAPGVGAGVTFTNGFYDPAINNAGNVAFVGSTTRSTFGSSDQGLWVNRNGSLQKVAVTGDIAPGTSQQFRDGFSTAIVNAQGRTAFTAHLNGSNPEGIWSEGRTGALELVARDGQQVPGLPAGYTFNGFRDPSINASGRIAFMAEITPDCCGNTWGIWAQDANFNLQLIALAGSSVSGSGISQSITVGELNFLTGTGNEDGRSSDFNDIGQVGFQAGFTSGSMHAGFVSNLATIPEPSVIALLAVLCSITMARRIRNFHC
jgi:hypothetical protein